MKEPSIIQRSFQGWKMWLSILIGLSVAGWMLFSSISEVRFIKVADNTGAYSWKDSNHNGLVDTKLAAEFFPAKNGNYREETLSDSLTEIQWSNTSILWIFFAIVFMVGRDFFYMLRIRLLTHSELSWKSSFHVIMLWEFASALAPGVLGGAAVAMFILNKEKIDLGRSTAIIFITALMDNLFYILLIPFVFVFVDAAQLFPHQAFNSSGVQWVFWIGYSVFVGICLFMFTTLFIVPKLATGFLKIVFSLPFLNKKKEHAIKTGKDIEASSKIFKKESFVFWLKVFGATCASWTSRFLVINALLQAFLNLGIMDHLLILGKQLVLWLLMRVSPTPGGSGIAEYAFGELMVTFSQSALLLAALAILWRLISYFPYLFIGAVLLPRWLRKNR